MELNKVTAGGYKGKILRVNLSDNKFNVDPLPKEWIRDYIGGDGFGVKILYEEVPTGTEPLREDNKLIVATGPITGTMWPMSGRTVLSQKLLLQGFGAKAMLVDSWALSSSMLDTTYL